MKILMKFKAKSNKHRSMKFLGHDIDFRKWHEIEVKKEDQHLLKSEGVTEWFEIKLPEAKRSHKKKEE